MAGRSWQFYSDEGISGTKGRDKWPGLDALLKGVARREFDIVAAWSVCRLGRSLPASGRMLFGVQRVRAGNDRGSRDGRTGSRTVIRQAPGQAEDDAVQGAAYPCGIG